MENNQNISWNLILRKITGEPLTQKEEKIFNKWIEAEERHRIYFEKAQKNWSDTGTEVPQLDLEKLIERFDRFAEQTKTDTHTPVVPKRNRVLWHYLSYAATILLPACLIVGILLYSNKEKQVAVQTVPIQEIITPVEKRAHIILDNGNEVALSGKSDSLLYDENGILIRQQNGSVSYTTKTELKEEKFNAIVVPRGGEYNLQLSDGTRVWINSGSSLKFPVQFINNERIVELTGEAYFEVAKDKSKPFFVKTNQQTIRVYGTSFNVEAYSENNYQYTTLTEGSVGIYHANHEYKLIPGQQAQVNSNNQTVKIMEVDAASICSWHLGRLSIENEPLENILVKISRWYDVDFTYTDNSLKDLHFTGDLERYANFSDILELIQMTTSVHFIIEGRKIKVTSR